MFGQSYRKPETPGFDDASWLIIGFCVATVIAFQLVDPFSIAWEAAIRSAAVIGLLLAGCHFYRRYRPRPHFSALLGGMAQLILFSIIGAALSYMVAAQGGELWDDRFQSWDRALGLDWLGYLNWVNDHPAIGQVYRWSYVSLIPQLVVLVMALTIAGKLRTMRIVIAAAMLSGLVAVLISGLTPAVSNFVHLQLSPSDFANLDPAAAFVHQAHFTALRDGSLRLIDIRTMQGIITFPSYHAALGAIFIWGFLRLGPVGWAGAIWSGIMLLATPIDGAHYFVDVFAGVALAIAGLMVANRLVDTPCFHWISTAAPGRRAVPAVSELPA